VETETKKVRSRATRKMLAIAASEGNGSKRDSNCD
jgi:hypothetical protein